MSDNFVFIIKLKIWTVVVPPCYKSGKVIFIHIYQALIKIIFFIVHIVSFADTEEIALYLMALMKPEDIVLLKASNGMNLSEVVNILAN